MRKLCLPVVLAGAVLGCQAPGPVDEDNPNAVLPAGSVFVLQQNLEVAADDKKTLANLLGLPKNPNAPVVLTIQNGEVIESNDRARREPFCELDTELPRGESHVIASDRFVSGRASYAEKLTGVGSDDRFHITEVPLQSDSQPKIIGLRCINYGSPVSVSHVTIRQIRMALGDIMSHQLPGSPAAAPATTPPEATEEDEAPEADLRKRFLPPRSRRGVRAVATFAYWNRRDCCNSATFCRLTAFLTD